MDKNELNIEGSFTCFSWLLVFISATVIQDELRRNQIISVKEKASLVTIRTQIKTLVYTRRKNVASTAITTTSATIIVNTNIQLQVK